MTLRTQVGGGVLVEWGCEERQPILKPTSLVLESPGGSLSGEVRDRSSISGSLSEEQETGPVNAAWRPCG